MTFGILTISYKRFKVLHLFLASIKRLRQETGIDFKCVCVGDAEHKDICGFYGVHHVTMKNHPATDKWNAGTKWLMEQGVDWVIVLGSDDILSTQLLKNLIVKMEEGIDLIGINNIYFYCIEGQHKGKLLWHDAPDQILGVARCISRFVIEKVDGVPWNRKDRPDWEGSSWGMDGICLKNIARYVRHKAIVDGIAVDIKTEKENLNKFTLWVSLKSAQRPPEQFYSIMCE